MKLLVAVPVLVVITACSRGTPSATPIPTQPAPTFAPSDLADASPSVVPVLEQHTCAEFATQAEAQAFFRESGGPAQDLHNLDADHNGQACDEASSPTPALVGGPVPQQGTASVAATAPTPVPTPAGPPKRYASSSGSVDGHHGGSSSSSSSNCSSSSSSGCR